MKRDRKLIVLADRADFEGPMDLTYSIGCVNMDRRIHDGALGRARPVMNLKARVADVLARVTLLQRFALTSFVVILVLGVAIAYSLGRSIEKNALDAAVTTAQDTLYAQLIGEGVITQHGLVHPSIHNKSVWKFEKFLKRSILVDGRTVRVKVWNTRGRVAYSDDLSIVGRQFPIKEELDAALHGQTASEISNLSSLENGNDRKLTSDEKLLEVYIPMIKAHRVVGAFEIYQAYAPVQRQINQTEMQVYSMLGAGLVLLYLFLFGIVRQGSKTIATQRRAALHYTADLEESYNATIASLGAAVDARDSTTEEHAERVRDLSVALARWLGWPEEEVREMERGAALHDVGKIGISDTILLKPGALTLDEWEEMRRHPEIGHQMLRQISFLQNALPVVRHHHERWDGRGYPDGLRGEEIPLPARLFAVIDAYDAITTDRPYRRRAPREIALELILREAGTHFDPKMAMAFVAMMRDRTPAEPIGPHLVAS